MTEYEVQIIFLEKKNSRYDGARGVLSTAIWEVVLNIEIWISKALLQAAYL